MELRVFDTAVQPLGIVDEVISIIWQPTYWQQGAYGDFKLLAPITANNNGLLVKGNIVVLHGEAAEYSDQRGEWRRAAQITYRHITKDENGTEQIEVQGAFLKKWFAKRRIIKEQTLSGTGQQIINTLVSENCGSSAAAARKFPSFEMLEQDKIAGNTLEYAAELGTALDEALYDRALASKLGYDILINERQRLYGFWLHKGKDLTAGNAAGNTPCIFSRDFDNVSEQEYTESIENVKNVAYIISAADENDKRYILTVDNEELSGLERDELFIDATNISWTTTDDSGVEKKIDYATYMQLMRTKAEGELEDYGETINFESTIVTSRNVKYKIDFNVGDIITTIEKNWGIRIDARITQVTQTWQDGKQTITATFGDSLPTLLNKIKKAR